MVNLNLIIDIILLIAGAGLALALLNQQKKTARQAQYFNAILKELEGSGFGEAIAKAKDYAAAGKNLTDQDLSSLKSSAAKEVGGALFEKEYKQVLDVALTEAGKQFNNRVLAAESQFEQFLVDLEKQGSDLETKASDFMKKSTDELMTKFQGNLKTIQDQSISIQEDAQTMVKAKINELMLNFEQNLSTFLGNSQQKSLDAVNLEIKAARELIETYKQQQMRLIDENVVAVLERTLNLVLRKKLGLKDQVDLVFESLEKAKAEKFLV